MRARSRSGMARRGGPAGPPWLMALLYAAALLVLQSLLSRLLVPLNVPPPDLFLLTAAGLSLRLTRGSALLGAYGLGLAQDVLGAGTLGLHAAGLAGGTLVVLLLRRVLPRGNEAGMAVWTVLAALLGQWLTFMVLTYWLRTGLVTADTLLRVLPLSFVTTLIAAPLWTRFGDALFGRRPEELT